MKKYPFLMVFFIVFIQLLKAQLVYIVEDTDENVEIVGNWKSVNYEDCFGGSALYTRKGDGSAWVRWNYTFNFPGLYQVETYVREYKYGQDTRWTITTAQGDTTVIVDEYYNPGWQLMGTFEFDETTSIKLTNYFESDSGNYVYGDAIRFTSMMPLYKLSGSLIMNGQNQFAEVRFKIEKYGISEPIAVETINFSDRSYSVENLTPGYYKITCFAWGYDSLVVDSLEISDQDISNYDLTLNQSPEDTYSISGLLEFDDTSDTAKCIVNLFSNESELFVSTDTVSNSETYSLPFIPNGNYRLEFSANGYIDDKDTYSSLIVSDADVVLDTMLLYAYFNFAWITDSHIGAGFTEAGLQTVIQNINQSDEELQFVIHTGDLTEKGLNAELNQYYRYTGDCKLPVYSIPGNHDTKWTESGMETFKSKNNGATHFSFNFKGYHFVGLNSGIPMRGGGGYIDPSELTWLQNDLEQLPGNTPIIACVHHPADAGGVFNNWQFLDILKEYHTIFIMVGHGHSNRAYTFEGIPGAMGLPTYGDPSGYNVVQISKKNITIATHYTGTGLANPWLTVSYLDKKQPQITFTDLNEFDQISSAQTVHIHSSEPATSGRYEVTKDTQTGKLTGSGNDWSLTLPYDGMSNGYHTLTVWLKYSDGKEYCRTIGYYIENGYPYAEWKFHTGSQIISSPAFDNDNVYFGTIDGKIYGLSLSDGTEAWPAIETGKTIFSSPCVHDGVVYIGSSNGLLYAISADSGNVLWTYDAGSPILNAITGADSLIYFAANRKMIAINSKNGTKIWSYGADGTIECRPAIEDDKIVFGSWDTKIHCLNRFNGTLLWKWNEQTSFYYAPAACWPVTTHDRVFVSDPARYMYAIDLEDGTTIWKSKSPETWESIGISERLNQVYIRSLDGNLYAFSTTSNSQQQLWSAPVGYGWDSTPSMPVGVRGAVISGGKNGFIVSVSQENGQIGWKYWVSHSYVTTVAPVDGASVLAAALDGTIMLVKADPSLAVGQSDQILLPFKTKLGPVYPNPFNNIATITYSIEGSQEVRIQIVDLLGRNILSVKKYHEQPGQYQWIWNGKDSGGQELSSGLYFIRMKSKNYIGTNKLVFLK